MIEPLDGGRHHEEVTVDKTAARIARHPLSDRKQSLLVPFDDLGKRIHHYQRSYAGVLEHRARGVAKPQAADHHVEMPATERRQPEPSQFDLGCGELARHQELVAELDFVNIDIRHRPPAAPQAQYAHRRWAEIQLFERKAHTPSPDRGPRHKMTWDLPALLQQRHPRALAKGGR